jgi:transcriptional regulator with XRE-family HTH domain
MGEADLDKAINIEDTLEKLKQSLENRDDIAALCAFGARLRRLQKLKDLEAESIARMVGVELETVRAWELAKAAPTSSDVHKLCEILGCRAYQLLQRPAKRASDWDLIQDYTTDELRV